MLVGYARTSTVDQVAGLDAQLRLLKAQGCERFFSERVSSVATRKELEAVLDFVREGDKLLVTKLDRLARSISDLVKITDRLKAKGVTLSIMDPAIDTSTPTGKLTLNLFGSIAQFEREIMLERQREGIASAKAQGKYKGRAPTAQRQAASVVEMRKEGKKPDAIATALGISRASVFRLLKAATSQAPTQTTSVSPA